MSNSTKRWFLHLQLAFASEHLLTSDTLIIRYIWRLVLSITGLTPPRGLVTVAATATTLMPLRLWESNTLRPQFWDKKRIESAINRLFDVDWLWWPFLFMRPKQKQQRFSFWRVLLFGVIVTIVVPGLVIPLRIAMNRRILFALDLVPYLFVFATSYFGVVAYFWNRRAGRLALGG